MNTYKQADEKLGARESRKIANNTYLQRRSDGSIAVKLHATDVVVYHADGSCTLNTGGWKTVTTKARINDYAPVCVWSDKGVWKCSGHLYADGMRIMADGSIEGTAPIGAEAQEKKLRASVARYSKAFAEALQAGKVPAPSAGDCWCCCMFDGKSDASHLHSHLEERYFVPSLAVNAVRQFHNAPATMQALYDCFNGNVESGWVRMMLPTIQKSIRRYVGRGLGMAV